MLYLPLLDRVLTDYAPIIAARLVPCGQAVIDPPHRPGGYTVASDRLHQLLLARAIDMSQRLRTAY